MTSTAIQYGVRKRRFPKSVIPLVVAGVASLCALRASRSFLERVTPILHRHQCCVHRCVEGTIAYSNHAEDLSLARDHCFQPMSSPYLARAVGYVPDCFARYFGQNYGDALSGRPVVFLHSLRRSDGIERLVAVLYRPDTPPRADLSSSLIFLLDNAATTHMRLSITEDEWISNIERIGVGGSHFARPDESEPAVRIFTGVQSGEDTFLIRYDIDGVSRSLLCGLSADGTSITTSTTGAVTRIKK